MKKKVLKTALLSVVSLWVLALSLAGGALAADEPDGDNDQARSTSENFLRLEVRPIAIGHHGVGPNTGQDPNLPIENTVESVRKAYELGARGVEVDVQLTQDNRLAVYHDDYLSDFTCIHSLTLDQLQQRMPLVPELHDVLQVARHFNEKAGDDLGGILIVELKAFSPHCDQPVIDSRANPSHHRLAGHNYQQEKFPWTYLGGHRTGVSFARLRFAAAVPGDGNGNFCSCCGRRDGFLRACGTATAGQRRGVRRGRSLARFARLCRSRS